MSATVGGTAVEGAAEVVVVNTCHAADADVGAELHRLAAEAVVGEVVVEHVAEDRPVGCTINKVCARVVSAEDRGGIVFAVEEDAVLIDGHVAERLDQAS